MPPAALYLRINVVIKVLILSVQSVKRGCLQVRVEGMSHSSVSSSTSSPAPSPSERPAGPPTPSSTSTPTPTQTPPQPEIVAIDREAASKGLMEWLRQNPSYSMDLPTFAHVRPVCPARSSFSHVGPRNDHVFSPSASSPERGCCRALWSVPSRGGTAAKTPPSWTSTL